MISAFTKIKSAYAVSCKHEWYVDDKCEIYLEYFPIFPTDSNYLTASEEFAIKFRVRQKDWMEYLVCHFVPLGWTMEVFFRDNTCGKNDWVMWKIWYPTSTNQNGITVTRTLWVSGEPININASVQIPPTYGFKIDYTRFEEDFNGKKYMSVAFLGVSYFCNNLWGSTYAEGVGSIGIPNDLAQAHIDHHVTILVKVTLYWVSFTFPTIKYRTINLLLGDGTPSTDCWLMVKQI
ncbi:MAG: hypothetical protein QXF75_06290 [Candidatus Bathyarchaeia archaeon]